MSTVINWQVFYHSSNTNEIKTFNIFDHNGFRRDLKEAACKYSEIEEFAEAARRALLYYFWGKCEWETLIIPWVGDAKTCKKVDVYRQIRNAWDAFVTYCWTYRDELMQ